MLLVKKRPIGESLSINLSGTKHTRIGQVVSIHRPFTVHLSRLN